MKDINTEINNNVEAYTKLNSESSVNKCIYAYNIDTLILKKHNNNTKSKSRIKERAEVMTKIGLKKHQFNIYVSVGEHLNSLSGGRPPDNLPFNISSYYETHCVKKNTDKPKTPKPVKEKVNWELKYNELSKEFETFKQQNNQEFFKEVLLDIRRLSNTQWPALMNRIDCDVNNINKLLD